MAFQAGSYRARNLGLEASGVLTVRDRVEAGQSLAHREPLIERRMSAAAGYSMYSKAPMSGAPSLTRGRAV